jgi:hypothetical protein
LKEQNLRSLFLLICEWKNQIQKMFESSLNKRHWNFWKDWFQMHDVNLLLVQYNLIKNFFFHFNYLSLSVVFVLNPALKNEKMIIFNFWFIWFTIIKKLLMVW